MTLDHEKKRKLRKLLSRFGLLPPSKRRRSPIDRRSWRERRVRHYDDYLITEGADRRFQPERRSFIERRVSSHVIHDLDIWI